MSKLQKSAWINLVVMVICTIIGMICFVFLAQRNAKGIDYVIICLIVACLTTPLSYWYYKKKSIESRFDEREKTINQRAFFISVMGAIAFLGLVCIIPFFIIGGGGVIKILYLPLIFLGTGFTGQFIQSMAIIIQCALEEENGK
jgi:hypothetical protein